MFPSCTPFDLNLAAAPAHDLAVDPLEVVGTAELTLNRHRNSNSTPAQPAGFLVFRL